jgi:hypothetical protein
MSEPNKKNTSELLNELDKLGENLVNLLRSAWESDERRSIEREVTAGLEQMGKKFNDAAEKIKTDTYVNSAKQTAKDAWESANVPQVIAEMRKGVIGTLQRINEDLGARGTPAYEASTERAAKSAERTAESVVEAAGGKPE